MESSLIRERVLAGLDAAKENGTRLGRPPLTDKHELVIQLYRESSLSTKEIATESNLALSTVYKIIKNEKKTI